MLSDEKVFSTDVLCEVALETSCRRRQLLDAFTSVSLKEKAKSNYPSGATAVF
ncbi:MAG: hypothetical protein V7K43_27305 [Nostoc sp.]